MSGGLGGAEGDIAFFSELGITETNNREKDYGHDKYKIRFSYRVGEMGMLVAEKTLCEVMRVFKVYPLPRTQSWLRGLVNVRGNLIPVYDIGLMLGFREYPVDYENLLVLGSGGDSIGMFVDNLPRSIDVQALKRIDDFPEMEMGLNNFITKAYMASDITWIEYDHVGFFKSLKDRVVLG